MQLKMSDEVLLLLPECTQKFSRKWQGPFTVKQKLGQVNYEVVVNPNGQTKVFHINLHADRMLRLIKHNYANDIEIEGDCGYMTKQ